MGSWDHMGHTGNTFIKDVARQMCIPLDNGMYFGDGNGVDLNPDYNM